MEKYSILIVGKAKSDYMGLDGRYRSEALRKVKALRKDPYPSWSHPLRGPLRGFMALEIGRSVRAIYKVNPQAQQIVVYALGQHENFYDEVIRRLRS